MYFVHENSEALLKGFIKSIEPKPQSWRVISIEFQDCDTIHSPLFQNLCLKNLHDAFDETDCRIYWVKPNFVLVLFQGRALPVEKCVEEFLKQTEFRGFGRFFDILDLSVHWSNLLTLLTRISAETHAQTARTPLPPSNPESSIQNSGFVVELSREKIQQMFPTRAARKKPLLLLVEDDPFTLQLVKIAMKDMFDIIAAETARQALSFYQRHLPDMVFLDIQLPDGNGINILKQIQSADKDCYAVMLSSHSQKEKILDCLNNGAKGFIAKPFTRQRLIDAATKFKESSKPYTIGGAA